MRGLVGIKKEKKLARNKKSNIDKLTDIFATMSLNELVDLRNTLELAIKMRAQYELWRDKEGAHGKT